MAGAQAAEACTEPTLGDLPARGEEKQLVRFELAGLTAGSEYLVKVNGRERKSGVATTDKVSRRFRMPHLGDSNRRVKVEVVIANDSCETSPWKLEEKMTYKPAPAPPAQVEPSPTPSPTPDPSPSPSPPAAPSPPPAPSITDSAPTPKAVDPPAVPKSSITPTPTPTPVPPAGITPAKEGRAWVTPTDPYQKLENVAPKLNDAALARIDRPSDLANSTAALIGLGGLFLLLAGIGAMGWTRFRRYDDRRLDEILNPEGKLPTHLDPEAKDMGKEAGAAKPAFKPPPPVRVGPLAEKKKKKKKGKQGVLAHLSDEEKASMSEEELEALTAQFKKERRKARKARRKAVLPTFDPTDAAAAAAAAAAGVAGAEAGGAKAERGPRPKVKADRQEGRRFLRRKARATEKPGAEATEKPKAEPPEKPKAEPPGHTMPNGKPPPQAVPPIPAPHVNGGSHGQGAGTTGNGAPPAGTSHREQVETELQRILDDAGLHTEVDGILADVKAEAQRQGVPIDSELMLKALCEDTNGVAKLSDSAKGELESRFKRIISEERGERGSTPGSQPPRG
jgi:hypothetical protein